MPENTPSTARLEAFSDGVIAVIITIMVLELKVPHLKGPEGLYAVLPTLLVDLLSFAFTAIYWINHTYLVKRVESADPLILYANLGFLFFLSLLPFFTAYVIEQNDDAFSVALYSVSMVITGVSFLLLRLAVHRHLRKAGNFGRQDAAEQRKHLVSLGLYVVAIPLAYFRPGLALAIIAVVTVMWVVPSLAIARSKR